MLQTMCLKFQGNWQTTPRTCSFVAFISIQQWEVIGFIKEPDIAAVEHMPMFKYCIWNLKQIQLPKLHGFT